MTRRALLLLGLLATSCGPRSSQPATETPGAAASPAVDVEATFEGILDAYLLADPVTATSLGDHRNDGAWPDLSDAAMARDLERVKTGLAALEALPGDELTADQRVDADILRVQLELQLLDHEVTRSWRHDPLGYAYYLGSGLDDLVSREFAPLPERADSVAARLESLPTFVEQALGHLRRGPVMKPQTEVAIGQLDGVVTLIKQEIPKKLAGAPEAVRKRVEAATPRAVDAVSKLRDVLRSDLLPKATHPWRLGPEVFERKLGLTLHTDLTAAQVYELARTSQTAVRAEMALQARDLYEPLFGKEPAKKLTDDALVHEVLEALAVDHPTPEGLRDAAEETLQRLEAFVKEQGIVEMDDREVLKVIWTPPHQQGVAIAGLSPPGPLDATKPGLASFYLVQPLPVTWTDAVRESFLREYNSFMLEVLSIHEAIPGHFVQLYYGNREPSRIRRVFGNTPFIEGWAVYSEQVMVERGYAGAGPAPGATKPRDMSRGLWAVKTDDKLRRKAIALHRNKFWLRAITNAILDHDIHAGEMTEKEALEMMIDQAFQQTGEAKAKWVRAQVTSTQLSSYFVGATAWNELRKQARAKQGSQFHEGKFHAEALSHGAPPVHRLPELLGW